MQENKQANIQDTTVGVVAYITLIGFIIAIVLNSSKQGEEKKFGAFHLRQALGLIIFALATSFAFGIITFILGAISWALIAVASFISLIIWLGFLALIIMGIVNAANKTYKEVPIIGKFSSKLLGRAFE